MKSLQRALNEFFWETVSAYDDESVIEVAGDLLGQFRAGTPLWRASVNPKGVNADGTAKNWGLPVQLQVKADIVDADLILGNYQHLCYCASIEPSIRAGAYERVRCLVMVVGLISSCLVVVRRIISI